MLVSSLFKSAAIFSFKSAHSTRLGTAQVSRLRETVIKLAAKVTVFSRKIFIELTSHCPFRAELMLMSERLFLKKSLLFS